MQAATDRHRNAIPTAPKFREAEEARNARRTVPVATYVALGMIAVVYAGASWAMAVHAGPGHVVTAAAAQGPGLLFGLGGGLLSATAQLLFLTSLFAAALACYTSHTHDRCYQAERV